MNLPTQRRATRGDQPHRRLTVRDHRGKPVSLAPGRSALKDTARPEVDWSFTIPLLGCLGFVGMGVCAASSIVIAAFSGITKGAPIGFPLVIGAVVTTAYFIFAFVLLRHRRSRSFATYLVKADLDQRPPRCPACAFTLVNLIPEPDGCTICPECGGAWRLLQPPEGASGSA